MTKLKSCPSCGPEGSLGFSTYRYSGIDQDFIQVECICEFRGPPAATEEDAIKAWNTRADDWQTIDTAPKDGTRILIFENGDFETVFWSKSVWIPKEGGWVNYECRADTYIYEPTHWQPLPTPPQETER